MDQLDLSTVNHHRIYTDLQTVKILLTAVFLFQSVWAQSPKKTYLKAEEIIYNPGGSKPGRYMITYKDFEDVRIDGDMDGQIDLWYIKKGTTEIYTHFENGQAKHWQVRLGGNTVREAAYSLSQGKWEISNFNSRKPLLMNLQEEGCEVSTIQKKLKSFTADVSYMTVASSAEELLLDSSCVKNLSSDDKRTVVKNISQALVNPTIQTCLNNPKFQEAVSEDKFAISGKLLAAKFELQKAQLSQQPKHYGPLLKCEKAEGQNKTLTTDESTGFIHLDLEKAKNKPTIAGLGKAPIISAEGITHELLHRAGLKKESEVKAVEDLCAKLKKGEALGSDNSVQSIMGAISVDEGAKETAKKSEGNTQQVVKDSAKKAPVTKTDSNSAPSAPAPKSGTEIAAKAATANIPVELTVAQTQIPPANTLSESISNPAPVTEAGSQQALVRSASESSGMLRMANNLAGSFSTQAVAADTGSASGGSGSKEVSRSVASTGAPIKASNGNPASDLLKASARTLSAGDRVVEEITIDGPSTAQKAAPTRSANVASASAPTDRQAPSSTNEASRAPASQGSASGEVGSGMAAGGGGGGFASPSGSVGSSLGFSGGGSAGAPVRGPAATNPEPATNTPAKSNSKQEVGSSSAGSREKIITDISRNTYKETKQKLSDPEFGKQLESQKITILDLYGNSTGAKKGEVIFLDQGDRFVRQK